MTTQTLELSPWQIDVMGTPEDADLLLLGGRGSGKTKLIGPLFLRAAEQLGVRCRALYVRFSHAGTREIEGDLLDFLTPLYPRNLRYNGQERLLRLPSGASLQIEQMAEPADYRKFMGKNFGPWIAVDEVGEYPDLALVERLRASLRPPRGVPGRMILIGNPGGPSHALLQKKYIAGTTPWVPRKEGVSGRHFVWCPSTYRDNPYLDQVEYRKSLEAACAGDPALLAAWADGSFAVAKGAFFAAVLDEARNATEPWDEIPHGWPTWLAHDWGSAAPSVTLLFAESPGAHGPDGRFYPRGSLVIIDEFSSAEPGSVSRGMGYAPPRLADEIRSMCTFWGVKPDGVADDACFAKANGATSIADEFRRCGVHFYPARKGDRISGWARMRRLLADAGKLDLPGLYVSRRCGGWWATTPALPRDPRRIEDIDTRASDHWADASRYGCLHQRRVVTQHDMYARV